MYRTMRHIKNLTIVRLFFMYIQYANIYSKYQDITMEINNLQQSSIFYNKNVYKLKYIW